MINEQQLEALCIGWFQEIGWQFAHGPDIAPEGATPERADYRQVMLKDRLLAVLARINPHIPAAALEQAVHALQTISEPQLVVRNRSFHRTLLAGVPVEFPVGDSKKIDLVHLIDFANPRNNEFLVVNQFTITGAKQPRRPDLIAFINGLPLAVIKLKNPAVGYIREHFDQKTKRSASYRHDDKRLAGFNSLFATASIEAAKLYYSAFTSQQKEIAPAQRLKVGLV